MKKIIRLAIVIIIAGAAIWLFQNKKPADESNSGNQEITENQESVLASTSTISQSDIFYDIKANFPQFTEADSAFNQKIADLISGKIDAFKKDAKDSQDARNATLLPGEELSTDPPEPFDFIADWQATQVNAKYISFVITMYYYVGGAHGINEVYTFNYNVADKKEITIYDFLNSSEENLQKLSDLSVQKVISYLKTNVGSVDESMKKWAGEGAGPEWENFKDLNFKNDSMIIYFQQYQVAAGVVGPVTVILPKEQLEQSSIASDYLE